MYNYFNYLKKLVNGCSSIAKKTHYPMLYFCYDYACALIFHGCLIRHYTLGEFWRLKTIERKDSLTYFRVLKIYKRFNDDNFINLLERKEEFNRHFAPLVKRDWIYARSSSLEEYESFLRRHEHVMVKPISAMEGHGITKESTADLLADAQGSLKKYQTQDVIMEEVIIQHPQMVFGNKSVNTIRMYTAMDKKGGVYLLKALLRVGIGDSVVDNYGSGGVFYEVDIDTGIIISAGNSRIKSGILVHPQTDIVMLGYKIPNWEIVKNECIRACKMIPQVRFVAWDIAITQDGVEFIEGNENGDYELLEFTGTRGYWKRLKEIDKK